MLGSSYLWRYSTPLWSFSKWSQLRSLRTGPPPCARDYPYCTYHSESVLLPSGWWIYHPSAPSCCLLYQTTPDITCIHLSPLRNRCQGGIRCASIYWRNAWREKRESQGSLGEPSQHDEGLISAGERGKERWLGRKSLRLSLCCGSKKVSAKQMGSLWGSSHRNVSALISLPCLISG